MARPAHILVIDDETLLCKRLSALLRDEGYQVTPANSGAAGLAALAAPGGATIDVVLTDLVMMPPDGYAVMEAIQQQGRDLPVIVMTAYGSLESAIKALRLGAYDYIQKPFDIELAFAALARALERQRLREAERRNRQLEAVIALADTTAHELNQPLSVLLGYLQMLDEENGLADLPPETIQELRASARDAAAIVEKMGRIVRYETRPYAGDSFILDLERSTEATDAPSDATVRQAEDR